MPLIPSIISLTRQPNPNHSAIQHYGPNAFYHYTKNNQVIEALLNLELYPLIKKAVYAEFRSQSKTDYRLHQYTDNYIFDWVVQDLVTHIHKNKGLAFPQDWRPNYHWRGRMLRACKNKTKDVLDKIRHLHEAEQTWFAHLRDEQDWNPEKNVIHSEISDLQPCIDPLYVAQQLITDQPYALLVYLMLEHPDAVEITHFVRAHNPVAQTQSPLTIWNLWRQHMQEYLSLQHQEGSNKEYSREHILWILFGQTNQSKEHFLQNTPDLKTIRDTLSKTLNRLKKKIGQHILAYSLCEIDLLSFEFTCEHTARIVDSSYLIRNDENEKLIEELLRAKQDDDIETIARLLFSKRNTVRERINDRKSYIGALNTRIQTIHTLFPNIKVA